MKPAPKEKFDVYAKLTSTIIETLENGNTPAWFRPWRASHAEGRILRPLRATGEPYRGINTILLWCTAMTQSYASPFWLTYNKAQELGAQVRKGERGTMVVYANRIERTETNARGEEVDTSIPFLKAYTVFNAEQVDGLSAGFQAAAAPPALSPVERMEHAEAFFRNTGADIRTGGDRAYYSKHSDHVQLPPIEVFVDPQAYYATGLHELAHWTRHPARLNRDFGQKKFGDEAYAGEEIVAELTSVFLAADLGIEIEPRADHASYIANWLQAMKDDKRFITTAAGHAQRAADYLHGLQPK